MNLLRRRIIKALPDIVQSANVDHESHQNRHDSHHQVGFHLGCKGHNGDVRFLTSSEKPSQNPRYTTKLFSLPREDHIAQFLGIHSF